MGIKTTFHSEYSCDVPDCKEKGSSGANPPLAVGKGFQSTEVRITSSGPGVFRAVHCEEHSEEFRRQLFLHFGFTFSEHG